MINSRIRFILFTGLCSFISGLGTAYGDNIAFNVGSGRWTNAALWTIGGLPAGRMPANGDNAQIVYTYNCQIQSGDSATTSTIVMRSNRTLTMSGGSLNTTGQFYLGYAGAAGNTARFDQSAGVATIGTVLRLGGGTSTSAPSKGIYNISGGTLSVGSYLWVGVDEYGYQGSGEFIVTGTSPVINITGHYSQNSIATLKFNLASTGVSKIKIGGNAAIAGNLVIQFNEGHVNANEIVLLEIDGTSSGNFIGLNEGTFVANDGVANWYISYIGGIDNNDVVLTTTPKQTATWVGTTSSAWNNSSNWSGGIVPDINVYAIIQQVAPTAYNPDISAGIFDVNGLMLAANAKLAISGGRLNCNQLTIETSGQIDITGQGQFVLPDNAVFSIDMLKSDGKIINSVFDEGIWVDFNETFAGFTTVKAGRACEFVMAEDFDEDCYVRISDMAHFAEQWLSTNGLLPENLDNQDGVKITDFNLLANAWQNCNNPDDANCNAMGLLYDMKELRQTPNTYPAPSYGVSDLQSLFYDGRKWFGNNTRVFAYYQAPPGASAQNKVPAVVCVHGGGGTAFADWVRIWNSYGYAAIAMDTGGAVPDTIYKSTYGSWPRHQWAGPPEDYITGAQKDWPMRDQWLYHCVADAIIANSLLRSKPEIDANNIGITGISWGGYKTSMAIGIDYRFRFAVPVYGCGFLNEDSIFVDHINTFYGMDNWMTWWDPSAHLHNAKMPTLWLNGTNDIHYHMPAFQKSFQAVQEPVFKAIRIRMAHSHQEGWAPPEIYAFANSITKGGTPLTTVQSPLQAGNQAWVYYSDSPSAPVTSAVLAYTLDNFDNWPDRYWYSTSASIDPVNKKVSAALPVGTVDYYFTLTDSRGLMSSSSYVDNN